MSQSPGFKHGWYICIIQEPYWALRYGSAFVFPAIALLCTELFHRLDPGAEFRSLNLAAVIFVALYGGMRPALMASVLTALGVDYFFVEPRHEFMTSLSSFARIFVYAAVAATVSSLVASLRTACRTINDNRLVAEQVSRARQNVLAIVAHDLKNPISAQKTNVTLLERDFRQQGAASATIMKSLELMRSTSDQLLQIVEDLQDAVKIELGQFTIRLSERNPEGIIQEAVENAKPLAQQKNLAFEKQVVAGLSAVSCDRVEQVISNLLSNAIKFTPPGGKVLVRAEPDGDFVKFSVQDTGPGIPGRDLPHLFDRFWQGKSGKDSKMGSGLGLFISKGIVESNGGSIGVESTPGEGSKFYFSIPTPEGRKRLKSAG